MLLAKCSHAEEAQGCVAPSACWTQVCGPMARMLTSLSSIEMLKKRKAALRLVHAGHRCVRGLLAG